MKVQIIFIKKGDKMTHEDEIQYWGSHPDGTKVWSKEGGEWELSEGAPAWLPEGQYIVDNDWAELRKAQADGEQLQYHLNGREWKDSTIRRVDYVVGNTKPENWRIEVEYEYQWLIVMEHRYDMTSSFYATKEEAQEIIGGYGLVTEPFAPSQREIK